MTDIKCLAPLYMVGRLFDVESNYEVEAAGADGGMTQHAELPKHRIEAIVDVVIEYERTESAERYLASGRRFANLETEETKRRWTAVTRAFLVSYGSVNPREMDDLASELGLRSVPLPVENVADETAAVARRMKYDNDPEVRARVRARIRSLLEDLKRRRN